MNANDQISNYRWYIAFPSILLTIISFYTIATIQIAMPKLIPLYADFGSVLPKYSEFMFSNYAYGWLFPVVGLLACINVTLSKQNRYHKYIFAINVLSFGASYLWREAVVLSAYLPMQNLGQVI